MFFGVADNSQKDLKLEDFRPVTMKEIDEEQSMFNTVSEFSESSSESEGELWKEYGSDAND